MKLFLLSTPHITLLYCDNLNPDTPLSSITSEVHYNCIMMMYHLLTMPLQLLLMLLRQHFYLRLHWPHRLNYMLLHKPALAPRTKLPVLMLMVNMLSEQLIISECCISNRTCLLPVEILPTFRNYWM